MSKFTPRVVQNPRSYLFNQMSKTAFSVKTAKFLFIVLLTFAIALTGAPI
ncbi:hypothetical protein [Leptolyngbya sp. NIES-2104]|nr:hypothetical protein [Leptolyngbya sp. NIES-2104]GAP95570.1 hypothetical protein NIES2104_20940 [Leptolyngbya sp. NIES-2104]